ncbi:MAG: hypothetical protein HZB42_13675 [Sphingobacteriales bacterium]|nr:hypothetical protein [Sphingobacteriales bacterium]
MRKLILSALILCLISATAKSQDRIYRNNGKVIEAKIIEVGSTEVKYKDYNNPDGPVYVLETDLIKKIVYENGKEEKFKESMKDPERYTGQRNTAIKVNFLSALYGYSEISFEKSTGVGKGFELSLGIIGAGKAGVLYYDFNQLGEVKRSPFGFFVSGGFKFSKLPDFILFGKTRFTHLMQGTYAKPALYFGSYKENQVQEKANNLFVVGKQNVTFGALQLELGKQWVLGDNFVLNTYSGLGIGFDNKKEGVKYLNQGPYYYENLTAFNYVNARGGKSPGLSVTWGIKLGWLLDNKKEK